MRPRRPRNGEAHGEERQGPQGREGRAGNLRGLRAEDRGGDAGRAQAGLRADDRDDAVGRARGAPRVREQRAGPEGDPEQEERLHPQEGEVVARGVRHQRPQGPRRQLRAGGGAQGAARRVGPGGAGRGHVRARHVPEGHLQDRPGDIRDLLVGGDGVEDNRLRLGRAAAVALAAARASLRLRLRGLPVRERAARPGGGEGRGLRHARLRPAGAQGHPGDLDRRVRGRLPS